VSKDQQPATESPFATRRAALGMTTAMTAGMLAERALSPDSARAEGVTSINGKTGVVKLPGLTEPAGELPSWVERGSPAPAASGDETGATDTTALAAAMPAKGTLVLGVGPYYVTKLPSCGPEQAIISRSMTVVYMVGTGICWHVWNPEMSHAGGEAEWIKNTGSQSGGFIIDGSKHAVGKAIGVQCGDIKMAHIDDVIVRHFTESEDIGALNQSEKAWFENPHIRMSIVNCTTCVEWNVGAEASSSFDGGNYEYHLTVEANQTAISMQGGAKLGACSLRFDIGTLCAVGNTGVVWKLGTDESSTTVTAANITLQAETNNTGTGHITLEMGKNAESHTQGVIAFLKGTASYVNGNVKQPFTRFTHSGYFSMDENLGINQVGEGLNVVGGSTWSPGNTGVSAGECRMSVQTGDFFSALLAKEENVFKLLNAYPGRARRIYVALTQPNPATGTVKWSEPGNNAGGKAQTIKWAEGKTPKLSEGGGKTDIIQLITFDGEHWYGSVVALAAA
jgi:hypothetical protein